MGDLHSSTGLLNPCTEISGKGGKPAQKKETLSDQQAGLLLETIKDLPPYLFVMIGLYAGLRREEARPSNGIVCSWMFPPRTFQSSGHGGQSTNAWRSLSQFKWVWQYIVVRSTKERTYGSVAIAGGRLSRCRALP